MAVGVLALQGSFNVHISALRRLGVKGIGIRKPEQLQSVTSLIIPGGESTTIAKLAHLHNLKAGGKELIVGPDIVLSIETSSAVRFRALRQIFQHLRLQLRKVVLQWSINPVILEVGPEVEVLADMI